MYEPLGEELRLCIGEGSVRRLSEPVELLTRLLSPVPLRRLGEADKPPIDCRVRTPYPELLAFSFFTLSELRCFAESRRLSLLRVPLMSDRDVEVDSGLGGRLDTLVLPFGGSGKAPILVVFRTVLPGVGMPELGVAEAGDAEDVRTSVSTVLKVGTAGVDLLFVFGVGSPQAVTARRAGVGGIAEVGGSPEGSLGSGIPGTGFRVLSTGRAGRGAEGGASGGVEGCRRPLEVMIAVMDMLLLLLANGCSNPSPTGAGQRKGWPTFPVLYYPMLLMRRYKDTHHQQVNHAVANVVSSSHKVKRGNICSCPGGRETCPPSKFQESGRQKAMRRAPAVYRFPASEGQGGCQSSDVVVCAATGVSMC